MKWPGRESLQRSHFEVVEGASHCSIPKGPASVRSSGRFCRRPQPTPVRQVLDCVSSYWKIDRKYRRAPLQQFVGDFVGRALAGVADLGGAGITIDGEDRMIHPCESALSPVALLNRHHGFLS